MSEQGNRPACYILGSGRSLLDLTQGQRDFLSAHPHTLAMNKYLLFYRKLGIVPKNLFLADRHYPAHRVFLETARIAAGLPEQPTFYTNEYYSHLCSWSPKSLVWAMRERAQLLKRYKYGFPVRIPYGRMAYFKSRVQNASEFFWANDLEHDLYFYRGSLTVAINLANIIFPNCDIHLLGVDLDTPGAFYDEELAERPDLLDQYHAVGQEKGVHPTSTVISGLPGVQAVLPDIICELDRRGVRLVSGNASSLVVKMGMCDFEPVPSA